MYVGVTPPIGDGWQQDEDTLDTWFSSGTWTFSTLGWPKETPDLKQYHPTAWMQMGYELLFFWMARMIMMSTYALDQIPFREVYFHGMLRDTEGKKFSKSLGNGIDPMDIVRRYGADSLRLSLIAGISPGSDSKFYTEKIQGYRNFINKLWNISRFILTSVEQPKLIEELPVLSGDIDYWIWYEYTGLVTEVTNLLNEKMFSLAAEKLYDFTWSKFADWYLELAKIENRIKPETKKDRDGLLLYLLQNLLKLWHPFIPFVTEVIWGQVNKDKLLMIEQWPEEASVTGNRGSVTGAAEEMKKLQEIVTVLRNARAENKVAAATISQVQYIGQPKIDSLKPFIETLGRVKLVDQVESKLELKGSWFRLITDIQGVEKSVDQTELKKYIADLEAKLADSNFTSRAPRKVVDEVKKKLADARVKLE
ncbi:MAG: class I tRNA ligase family protein [Candidatus Komeilibacteria bacterium]